MAAHTVPLGHWIDVGSGVAELVIQNNKPCNAQSTGRWIHIGSGVSESEMEETEPRNGGSQLGTPPKSSARYSTGLITPPASEKKNLAVLTSQTSKLPHDEYHHKLRELDSKGRQLHRLVFRWWSEESQGVNTSTQLRAGLFKNPKTAIAPPFCGPKLQNAFLSHLTPELKASPFISVFESFLPALQRALKSEKDAYISIIDLHQVEKDSRKKFPKAPEVIWPIKKIVKQYGFKLRNHYRGNEWLVHGAIGKSAIVQTVKVSQLLEFARTGRIGHMRDVLRFIGSQKHAFALSDNLPVKRPKTSYRTGQLVGKVLDHIKIPAEYKAVLARKIRNVMHFEYFLNQPRERAYLKGVYNFDHPDSDSESDGLDAFVDTDEEVDSDATFWDDSDGEESSRSKRRTAMRDSPSSADDSEMMESSENEEDVQALLDAQLSATANEWMEKAPFPARGMLSMSHIEVPKLTVEQRVQYKLKATTEPATIDLTGDDDDGPEADEDVIEVQPWTTKKDVGIVSRAHQVRRSISLVIRSPSVRSTAGPETGLARLEYDTRRDVLEIMHFD